MDRGVLPAHYAAASERIKYALATSALLSADLRDALQLYPPLLPPPPPPVVTRTTRGRRRAAPYKATVEWPQGWQRAGSLVDNALNACSALVNSLTSSPPQATTPATASSSPAKELARPARDRTAQEAAIAAVNRFVTAAQHLDLQIAAALSAIKQLECIAHGLGLSDPLPPISRIEARSYSHLLLLLDASSSSSSTGATTTTPVSTPTAAIRRRPPPRPLRALALRRALARALDETLAVLERATADLNALLPRNSPLLELVPTKPKPPPLDAHSPLLPLDSSDSDSEERGSTEGNDAGAEGGSDEDMNGNRRRRRRGRKTRQSGGASIAELLRHDERARQERDELDKFNSNLNETSCSYAGEEEEEEDLSAADAASHHRTSSSSGHDPTTTTTMTTTVTDPYHPTENTFGGIERRRHASLNSPAAAVRLRDSLSSASPLRRSHRQRHSLSPRRRLDGPSSLEEEIIAAAAREEEEELVQSAETTRTMTPKNRGAARSASASSSSLGTPPPPPIDSWKRSRRRRPVSLGGVNATPTNLRRALSVHSSTPAGGGGGGGSRLTCGVEREESNADDAAAAAAESSKSPSTSSLSSSSSKSRNSGSPPLSATPSSSSPSPDPARLPAATTTEPISDAVPTTNVVPFLLVSLQDTFDDLHALRRGVIWRLLEALSGAESDRNWNALAGVVGGGLAERMEEIAKEVEGAQEREFGESGAATAGVGVDGGSSAAAVGSTKDGRPLEIERRKEKEKRRRSGAYGRELLDDADGPDVVDVDVEENVFSDAGRTGEPATSSRRDALARLTGGTPSSSPTPRPSSSSLLDNKTKQNRRAPASYADFAPPSSASSSSTAAAFSSSDSADPDLVAHARAMALALRAIEATLRLVVDDVAHSPSGSLHPVHGNVDEDDDDDDEGKRRRRLSAVVEMYWGIGVELKRLEEQWRLGGEVLERAARLVQSVERANPASAEEAEVEPSVAVRAVGGAMGQEEEEEGRNQLGAEDAVLQTEPRDGTGEEDDPVASRQALVDAALSASLLIPPSAPAEEKVFEAVAGPVRSSDGGSNKFSREERIRRMKEAREALARGRESLESSPVKTRTDSASDGDAGSPLGSRSGGGSSSLAQQQKMVGELQEVLREYNRERGRNVGGPDTAAASTPLTPTKTTATTPPPPTLSLPPPPPVPFPVASPIVASSTPPPATFVLPPPPPPPAHRQPVTFALPQTPPRNAISPVTGLRGRPTPPPVQSPLSQKGTPSSSGKRYSVQSV